MLVIKKKQIEIFNEHFKNQFVDKVATHFPRADHHKILDITNEAIKYKIETEKLITKYIELFLHHNSMFMVKPRWMSYILKNDDFSAEDKLSYIENKINKSHGH